MPDREALSRGSRRRGLKRIWRLVRYRRWTRTIHVTIPAGQTAVAFTADQDGLLAGDKIIVTWERDDA